MSQILVGLSHKGGTGRTVTLANVAYQLVCRGHSVCLVDLDLASPTMGSVLGVADAAVGVAGTGVHTFLDPDTASSITVGDALIDLFEHDVPSRRNSGRFRFLPGTREGDLGLAPEEMAPGLMRCLSVLGGEFDFVLADVRSGASTVASALATPALAPLKLRWLFFYRWTPQHLAGLDDLVSWLAPEVSAIGLVRTAFIDPDNYKGGMRKLVMEMNESLAYEENNILDRYRDVSRLGTIPYEPWLVWKEGLLTDDLAQRGLAEQRTLKQLQDLASTIESWNV